MAQPNSSRTASDGSSGGSTTGGTSYAGDAGNDSGQRDTTLVGRVRERVEATLESQKNRATDGLGSVARAVRSTEEQLRSQHHESMAGYVAQVAERLDRFSEQLRDKRVHELLDNAQRFARRHPAAFAGSAFAVGLVAARFLKSSGDRSRSGSGYGDDTLRAAHESRYGMAYRSPQEESRESQRTRRSSASTSAAGAGGMNSGGRASTGDDAGSSASSLESDRLNGKPPVQFSGERGSAARSGGTGSSATDGTRGLRTGSETERP